MPVNSRLTFVLRLPPGHPGACHASRYVGVGLKPTPTIAASIAAAIVAPAIPAEPAGHHHNRAIRKTEWMYQ